MSPIWYGVKIWGITIFINAVLLGIGSICTEGIVGVGIGVFTLFAGAFFTLPLLLFIVPIVSISCRLPYSISGRTAWMGSFLALIISGYFIFLNWILDGRFFSRNIFPLVLTCVATVAMIIALWITHKSFIKLNTQTNEKHLV